MPKAIAMQRGFSLIELVIVLAIASVIGAIAVPRLSSVSSEAPMTAYKADLSAIQGAVERYAAEHIGLLPETSKFVLQLTQYTDVHGNVSAVKTSTHIYGPYLRKMPNVLVTPRLNEGEAMDADMSDGTNVDEVAVKTMGTNLDTVWMYDIKTGKVRVRVTP